MLRFFFTIFSTTWKRQGTCQSRSLWHRRTSECSSRQRSQRSGRRHRLRLNGRTIIALLSRICLRRHKRGVVFKNGSGEYLAEGLGRASCRQTPFYSVNTCVHSFSLPSCSFSIFQTPPFYLPPKASLMVFSGSVCVWGGDELQEKGNDSAQLECHEWKITPLFARINCMPNEIKIGLHNQV